MSLLPPRQSIQSLQDGVPELIQATTALPAYANFLAELVHNAIDAKADHISCWINPALWSMRVTDDGFGIAKEDLTGGLGCVFGMSNKYGAASGDQVNDAFLGSRGRGESPCSMYIMNSNRPPLQLLLLWELLQRSRSFLVGRDSSPHTINQ